MPDTKYYDRKEGQSSTSKYIQVNKNTDDGGFKEDSSALAGTPSDKIITPQLKVDTQLTKSFASNPLAKLLGFVSSLIPTANSKKVAEPKPTDDKAQYGKIQVKENKAGFIVINDETPGNVRQINLHPTGTYNAMLDNGDFHTKTTGDKQEITDGNWNITTTKDKIEIVSGDSKIQIRKNVERNIAGDYNSNIDGEQKSVVGGDVSNDFKGSYAGKIASDYTESVGGDKTEKTSGDLKETISGDHKETVQGALTITVMGNVNITSTGTTNIQSTGSINITSGGVLTLMSAIMVRLSAPSIKLG
jgi:hypothetical protein